MNGCDKYIRFDWAAKKILRDKANFSILEGLITVLLNDDTKIIEILESESNQSDPDDKFNRVDIKATVSPGEAIWGIATTLPLTMVLSTATENVIFSKRAET